MTVACSDASVGNVAQATGRTGALLCAAIATRIAWSMAWRQWRGGQMRIWVRGGALERVGMMCPLASWKAEQPSLGALSASNSLGYFARQHSRLIALLAAPLSTIHRCLRLPPAPSSNFKLLSSPCRPIRGRVGHGTTLGPFPLWLVGATRGYQPHRLLLRRAGVECTLATSGVLEALQLVEGARVVGGAWLVKATALRYIGIEVLAGYSSPTCIGFFFVDIE